VRRHGGVRASASPPRLRSHASKDRQDTTRNLEPAAARRTDHYPERLWSEGTRHEGFRARNLAPRNRKCVMLIIIDSALLPGLNGCRIEQMIRVSYIRSPSQIPASGAYRSARGRRLGTASAARTSSGVPVEERVMFLRDREIVRRRPGTQTYASSYRGVSISDRRR
jgi:hypothetical protein